MNKNIIKKSPPLKADKPHIRTIEIKTISYYRKMNTQETVKKMLSGRYVLVEEFFSNGLQLLAELKRVLLLKYKDKSFQGQRDYRSAFREASHRLLVKVKNHRLDVKKSPEIGWFKIFYPQECEFYISFPDVQGLNSSWQWYKKGIHIDFLDLSLHPYFGTYFPTRFDHLLLFDKWLKSYKGTKERAIDIGVGSGVLTFQLLKHGFQHVFATDSNTNAIIGVSEESERLKLSEKISLSVGDLFSDCDFQADLIVFNPPWLLAKHQLEEGIDKAIYYEKQLFPRFFEEAKKHLSPQGKLVLLFSNLAQVIEAKASNPIMSELKKHSRFKKEFHKQWSVKAASKKTKRSDSRSNEKVELWVLVHKNEEHKEEVPKD